MNAVWLVVHLLCVFLMLDVLSKSKSTLVIIFACLAGISNLGYALMLTAKIIA